MNFNLTEEEIKAWDVCKSISCKYESDKEIHETDHIYYASFFLQKHIETSQKQDDLIFSAYKKIVLSEIFSTGFFDEKRMTLFLYSAGSIDSLEKIEESKINLSIPKSQNMDRIIMYSIIGALDYQN